MPSYQWSTLSKQRIGAYAEYFAHIASKTNREPFAETLGCQELGGKETKPTTTLAFELFALVTRVDLSVDELTIFEVHG